MSARHCRAKRQDTRHEHLPLISEMLSPPHAQAGPRRHEVTARLLVDCMGHYSPVVKQMRGGSKPQGMVLVVGTCAHGVPAERNRCAGDCA